MVFTAFLAQFSMAFTSEIAFAKVPNILLIFLCQVLSFIDPILSKHYERISMLFLRLLGYYSSFASNFYSFF